MSEQNPNENLTWRRMSTDPQCDELCIEVAWGFWPYRITVYAHDATVQRFVPDSPVRTEAIRRAPREPIGLLVNRARDIAEQWDRDVMAGLAASGLSVGR